MEQKFKKGDHIQVADDLGSCMSHFTSGCEAIIQYSYSDKYGKKGDGGGYSVLFRNGGSSAWYGEDQLTLIARRRHDLIEQWEDEAEEIRNQKSDIDWIFANGEDVLNNTHGATVEALAKHMGISNLWGSHGEGMTYYANTMQVMMIAEPFLRDSDKEGFLNICQLINIAAE